MSRGVKRLNKFVFLILFGLVVVWMEVSSIDRFCLMEERVNFLEGNYIECFF